MDKDIDILNGERILSLMRHPNVYTPDVRGVVTSTNKLVKECASERDEGYVIIADRQTEGRGRLGRSFFSPAGSGVYFSLLLKPKTGISDALPVTTAAAVAVCSALKETFGAEPGIKWVNDIYIDGKKVCGILAESAVDRESGMPEYIVLGIGINVYEPEGGFPDDISALAGAVGKTKKADGRNALLASFLDSFYELENSDAAPLYKKYNITPGKKIKVIKGDRIRDALALDIDGICRLVVKYDDNGETEALSSGEISIKFI